MKAFLLRIMFVAPAVLLAGCGFHPLYGKIGSNEGPAAQLASVYVESIPERVGYALRNDLIDLFDSSTRPDQSLYRLQLTLREVREPVGYRGDATITRFNYRLYGHYELIERAGGKPIKTGDVRSITAYNVAQSPYATIAGEKDAQERAARDLAERIRTELAVYFRNAPPKAEASAAPNLSPTP